MTAAGGDKTCLLENPNKHTPPFAPSLPPPLLIVSALSALPSLHVGRSPAYMTERTAQTRLWERRVREWHLI